MVKIFFLLKFLHFFNHALNESNIKIYDDKQHDPITLKCCSANWKRIEQFRRGETKPFTIFFKKEEKKIAQ